MGLVDRLESQKRELVFKELLGKKYSSLNDFKLVYTPMEEITLISVIYFFYCHIINYFSAVSAAIVM